MGAETIIAAIGAAVAAGSAVSQHNASTQAAEAQQTAQKEAKISAEKQEKLADEARNRANMKKPDIAALLTSAQNMGLGTSNLLSAGSGTPNATLGRTSLLGG